MKEPIFSTSARATAPALQKSPQKSLQGHNMEEDFGVARHATIPLYGRPQAAKLLRLHAHGILYGSARRKSKEATYGAHR